MVAGLAFVRPVCHTDYTNTNGKAHDMTVTKTITTKVTLTTDDLPFDADLAYEPAEWIDPVVTLGANGGYTVAYAVHDTDAGHIHPINDTEGAEFQEFRTEWDRDEFYEATDLATHVPFVVDHFEHGSSIYSLAGTHADKGIYYTFDSRPSGVLRVPVDFTDPAEAAKGILAEYTSWVNGDVYGIVRQTFDNRGVEIGDHEAVWGFIGTEYAESVVKDIDSHL